MCARNTEITTSEATLYQPPASSRQTTKRKQSNVTALGGSVPLTATAAANGEGNEAEHIFCPPYLLETLAKKFEIACSSPHFSI